MQWIGTAYAYVLSHTRAQYHPAAYALLFSVILGAAMTAMLFVMSLIFRAFGSSGVTVDFETNAAVFGPVILGELVRGHVRAWPGYAPTDWCFPAIGIAGLTAGGVFGTFSALRWEEWPSPVPLYWSAVIGAVYLLVGWLMYLDERKRLAKAS